MPPKPSPVNVQQPSPKTKQPAATANPGKDKPPKLPTPPKSDVRAKTTPPQPTEPPSPTTDQTTCTETSAGDDLNKARIALTSKEPEIDLLRGAKKLSQVQLNKYALKKVLKHQRSLRFTIVRGRKTPRHNKTMNVDLPAFFLNFTGTSVWHLLKGPTNKSYSEPWWEYVDSFADVNQQMPLTTSGTVTNSLRPAARDDNLYLAQPTSMCRK